MASSLGSTTTATAEIHPENYRYLQDYIYRASGIVIDAGKHYLLEARLMPIVRKQSLDTVNDLCSLLRATTYYGSDVRKQVIEAMTTHESFFFRDVAQYEALRRDVIPRMLERRAITKRLTFWSAAASSGQEAYSLAMMLLEMGLRDWRIEITGTDLSDQILERARNANYLQIEVNRGLPASYLVKYFTRQGMEWRLKDEVRRLVSFRRFDLRQGMRGLGPFDVVFCRNVLIYFDQDTRRRILEQIGGTLNRGGYLLLGGTETTLGLVDKFERTVIGQAVLHRML
jgi:chemotaxis protein methyltransferase CheR